VLPMARTQNGRSKRSCCILKVIREVAMPAVCGLAGEVRSAMAGSALCAQAWQHAGEL
jgi:hypothetical protein